jgi:small subunit ribosomal protein S20
LSSRIAVNFIDLRSTGQETIMANTRSAKKATRVSSRRALINKNRLSRVRSAVREVESALESGNREAAETAFRNVQPELVRGAQKGILHKKAASRKISRLAQRLKKLS